MYAPGLTFTQYTLSIQLFYPCKSWMITIDLTQIADSFAIHALSTGYIIAKLGGRGDNF